MKHYHYGWIKDAHDSRDRKLAIPKLLPKDVLPSCTNNLEYFPPCYDQGQLGSCTANAIAGIMEFERKKQGLSDFVPSRLFIYYNERDMEGTVDQDSGAQIRDGIKSINSLGAPDEAIWPYDINQFSVKPPPEVYAKALGDRALVYASVEQTADSMKQALAQQLPFTIGFTVYPSFERIGPDGIYDGPTWLDKIRGPLGGHAVAIVDYDDVFDGGRFVVRNSWGTDWGKNGYFFVPYDYFADPNQTSDLWNIQVIGA